MIDVNFQNLAQLLLANVPQGREQSIMFTKLEESHLFARKAIAHTSDAVTTRSLITFPCASTLPHVEHRWDNDGIAWRCPGVLQ